jgi:hypothetical protein
VQFRGGPLPRRRGVAALGHRDVRVPSRLITVWDYVAAATGHGHIQSWRRQGGTTWLLLGRLSVGAEMTEQQPHEVRDHQVGFELRPRLQNSELAFPWFTCPLQRRLPPRAITASAVCPGSSQPLSVSGPGGGSGRAGRCCVPVPGISSRLSAKPEAPPASVVTAATEYSRPR